MPTLFKASYWLGILRALKAIGGQFEMRGQAKGTRLEEGNAASA